mgnify:CR=1 FL=1
MTIDSPPRRPTTDEQLFNVTALMAAFVFTRILILLSLRLEQVSFVANDVSYYTAYLFQLQQGDTSAMREYPMPAVWILQAIYTLGGGWEEWTPWYSATMLLLDVAGRTWSGEMLDVCGLTEDMLPAVHESYEPVGTLLPEVAERLGLPADVVVCAGAGDNAAAAVGCGVVGEGSCNISLGTSGTVLVPTRSFPAGVGDRIHSFCHADGGWHVMGCVLSAASCNSWWAKDVLGTEDLAGEQVGIDPSLVSPDQPYFLPYLMGERSPHNDPLARGAFVGLRMDSTRRDMTRAVLEGVAFAIRDSVEIARSLGTTVEASRVCGGGARSALWLRMMASVLDATLELPETEQGPGYGGAILAAVACGEYPSVADACERLVRVSRRVSPEPSAVEAYDGRYRIWRSLYPALREPFQAMGGRR